MVADGHKEYLGNFDIIKIIAANGIVFHHYQQISATKFGGGYRVLWWTFHIWIFGGIILYNLGLFG